MGRGVQPGRRACWRSDVASTSGSSVPHSTSTGTRTASSAWFVDFCVMNMALVIDANAVAVPASRSGCSRAASRPSTHRSTWAGETRLGSPPTRLARPRETAPASVIAVRLASRMRRPARRSDQACRGRAGCDDEASQGLPPERLDSRGDTPRQRRGHQDDSPNLVGHEPRGQRRHQATHRPAVQHHLVGEAELPDEGPPRSARPGPGVARGDTEPRCGRLSCPAGRPRPPARAVSGARRGRSTCSRCRSLGGPADAPARRAARAQRARRGRSARAPRTRWWTRCATPPTAAIGHPSPRIARCPLRPQAVAVGWRSRQHPPKPTPRSTLT